MENEDKIVVEMFHQSILLSVILNELAKKKTMPDKYFEGFAEGIRKNDMPRVPEKLRPAVRKRSGDFFDSLAKTTKKGKIQDAIDVINEFLGK